MLFADVVAPVSPDPNTVYINIVLAIVTIAVGGFVSVVASVCTALGLWFAMRGRLAELNAHTAKLIEDKAEAAAKAADEKSVQVEKGFKIAVQATHDANKDAAERANAHSELLAANTVITVATQRLTANIEAALKAAVQPTAAQPTPVENASP
jgi:hypothetical protein